MSSIRRIPAPRGFQADLVIPPRIGPAADGPPPVLPKRGGYALPHWPPLIDTRRARHAAFLARPGRRAARPVNWYFVGAVAFGSTAFALAVLALIHGFALIEAALS